MYLSWCETQKKNKDAISQTHTPQTSQPASLKEWLTHLYVLNSFHSSCDSKTRHFCPSTWSVYDLMAVVQLMLHCFLQVVLFPTHKNFHPDALDRFVTAENLITYETHTNIIDTIRKCKYDGEMCLPLKYTRRRIIRILRKIVTL